MAAETKFGSVTVTDQGLLVSWYYFPMGPAKLIRWSDIKKVEKTRTACNSKTWGETLSAGNGPMVWTWWNLDNCREFCDRDGLIIYTREQHGIFSPAAGVSPVN